MSTTSAPTAPAALGEQEAFAAVDVTWVSKERGWALGSCGPPACTTILETHYGGRSWARLPAPPAPVAGAVRCDPDACVSSIRFANEQVGWLFGPRLFLTTDGGNHWSEEPSPPVAALAASRRPVYRVVSDEQPGNCVPYCEYRVEEAAVGSSSWRRLPSPPFDGGSVQLQLEGPRIYVIALHNPAGGAEDTHASFVRSLDGGRRWQKLADPCGADEHGEDDAFSIAAAPGRFVAMACAARIGPTPPFVLVSTDAGSTWSPRRPFPVEPEHGGAGLMAAGSSRALSAWVEKELGLPTQRAEIVTSRDGGRTWSVTLTVPKPGDPPYRPFLGYQDGRNGRAFYGGRELWTTRDGGHSWTSTKF